MNEKINNPVLVLNQNYEPLNICGVRRAMVLVLKERAQMIQDGEGSLSTAEIIFPIPAVIRLFRMVKKPLFERKLSRKEVFWRDNYTCQYCGSQSKDLTLDHVIPRVRGGDHSWDNVVAACVPCNHIKASMTLQQSGMILMRSPKAPKANPYHHLMNKQLPDEWSDYIPWMEKAGAANC